MRKSGAIHGAIHGACTTGTTAPVVHTRLDVQLVKLDNDILASVHLNARARRARSQVCPDGQTAIPGVVSLLLKSCRQGPLQVQLWMQVATSGRAPTHAMMHIPLSGLFGHIGGS